MKRLAPMLLLALIVAFIVPSFALAAQDYDPLDVSGWPHKDGYDWIKMEDYEKTLTVSGILSGIHWVQDWTYVEVMAPQESADVREFIRSLKEKAELPVEEQVEALQTLWQTYPLFAVFNFKVGEYSDRLDAFYHDYDNLKTVIPLALMIVNADMLQEGSY